MIKRTCVQHTVAPQRSFAALRLDTRIHQIPTCQTSAREIYEAIEAVSAKPPFIIVVVEWKPMRCGPTQTFRRPFKRFRLPGLNKILHSRPEANPKPWARKSLPYQGVAESFARPELEAVQWSSVMAYIIGSGMRDTPNP